jgi:hypothetical protein
VICVQEFSASPDGAPFSWETSKCFTVGDRLNFVEGRKNSRFPGHPNEWSVVFRTKDNTTYSAAQNYFVTDEVWKRIEDYFAKRFASSANAPVQVPQAAEPSRVVQVD